MAPCEAVLFDLDGTLLDTLEDLADAVNSVLSARGLPEHPVEAYRYFVGDGAVVLLTRVLPKSLRNTATITACVAEFTKAYAHHWDQKTKPYTGIPELLDGLVARGLRIAVLSNKPHEYTLLCVDQLLSKWKFDVILGQGGAVPRKPDPGGALHIASLMGIPPAHFLYIGDTGTDMLTAVAAGMSPVGVMWGFRTREELLRDGADALVERPAEILEIADARRRSSGRPA